MNYRHRYHAGSFADVVKHSIQYLILESLIKKEKGFTYIDTHAGIGLYDLHDEASQKGQEYRQGIQKVMQCETLPQELKGYVDLVREHLGQNELFYPGSPCIAQHFLRQQDQLILNEWHPEDGLQLREFFKRLPGIYCHQRDAYEFLPAILPPTPRRGLVVIDPPYEEKNELSSILKLMSTAINKFPEGIYLLWYPIKEYTNDENTRMIKKSLLPKDSLHLEFVMQKPLEDETKLIGSGFVVVNPPWQFSQKAAVLLQALLKIMAKKDEGYERLRPLNAL